MNKTSHSSSSLPLCVDLDGTLIKTDLLHESVLLLLSRNPLYVFLLPLWLLRGKAALKHEIARRVALDPSNLPFDPRVLEMLRSESHRPRILCTASDRSLATPIAQHLGCFDEVLASDGLVNLGGRRKAAALVDRFGDGGFDYMANAKVDLDVWRHSNAAWLVNASRSTCSAASRLTTIAGTIPPQRVGLRTWIKAIRVHQWLKNLLVFVPLLASHRFVESQAVLQVAAAFLAFSLCASGVYVLNDLLDLASDRAHPRKRFRPFASGTLPVFQGMVAAPVLTLAGLALAFYASPSFAAVLVGYYVMTLAYSLRLKRVVMVDVVMLAALYTVRIIGGAVVIGSELSFWLLAFSMFVFLSLAMLKRYIELTALLATGSDKVSGRGYEVDDLPLIQSMGAASGYLAVLVFALYINSPESLELYRRPQVLWLICPLLLYWISRAWIKAHRGGMDDDPVVFAVTDRVSQVVIAICGLLVLGAI